MPELDEQIEESSPSEVEVPAVPETTEVAEITSFASMTPEQRQAMRKGEVKFNFQSKTADSTPAKAEESPAVQSDPAPENNPQEPKKGHFRKSPNGEARIRELAAENAALKQRLEASEKKPDVKPAEPSPAKDVSRETPASEDKPKRPKMDDHLDKTFEEFKELETQYYEDLAAYNARKVIASEREADRQKSAQAEAQRELQEFNDKLAEDMRAVAKKRPDFGEKAQALAPLLTEVITDFLKDSDHKAEMVYALGANPEETRRIAALPQARAVKELTLIETKIPNGTAPAPKRISSASPPPSQVSGRSEIVHDDQQAAVLRGDFAAYRKAKELARRKG